MFCKYCGKKMTKNDKYCASCGKSTIEEEIKPINVNELGKGRAIASLVIGIISVIFAGFIPLPIIGLILGYSYKGKCTEKTAGIILNIIGIILSVIIFVFFVIFGIVVISDAISDGNLIDINIEKPDEWDNYSKYIENDELDFSTSIVGNWKELSTYKSYLTFSENEYYFYDDINNMEKNYTTGTYTLYNGMEELSKLEEEKSFITDLLNKLINGKIAENFYIIKLNPIRTIKDGVEVSNETDEDKLYRTIYIDTYSEAIELTMSGYSNNETKHYYKILWSNE